MLKFYRLFIVVVLFLAPVSCGNVTPPSPSSPDPISQVEKPLQEQTDHSSTYGAKGALQKTDFTLKEMLIYAMQDEMFARGEYEYIIHELGAGMPFTNIIKAEVNHIALLRPHFEKYQITLDENQWKEELVYPKTIKEALETCIQAEIDNIAIYELFLTKEIPDDVRVTFTELKRSSESHLKAFTRNLNAHK